jgi:NAD(P)-dependent dehydrogenase (short-subunit alcohol dehydrogenase family)
MKPTAVVTGASKGLGEVIATFLARSGYNVVITARDEDALARAAKRIGATPIAGDVSDPAHRARLLEVAGDVDVLVNNASELGTIGPLAEQHDLARIFDVNVIAPIALIAEAKPRLAVNITSDAAIGAYEGWGGYGASKAALELASRTLAGEGHNVVVVDPGDMRTDMHQAAFPGEDISDRPLPDVTIPFWAWLFAADPKSVSGRRFQAQGERFDEDERTDLLETAGAASN